MGCGERRSIINVANLVDEGRVNHEEVDRRACTSLGDRILHLKQKEERGLRLLVPTVIH